MSPEEREKKRLWMEEYNRRRKASVTKTAQADLDDIIYCDEVEQWPWEIEQKGGSNDI